MTSRQRKMLYVCLIAAVLLGLALLVCAFLLPAAYDPQAGQGLDSIRIEGEYRVDGSERWYALTKRVPEIFDEAGRTIHLRGHFSSDVLPGRTILFRIPNLRLCIRVDGVQILSYGESDAELPAMRAAGNVWSGCISPGIAQTDLVEAEITSVYGGGAQRIQAFLDQIYVGSERMLLQKMLKEHAFALTVGIISLSLGFVLLLSALIGVCMRVKRILPVPYFAGVLIAAGLWIALQFDYAALLIPYPSALNILDAVALMNVPLFLSLYLRTFVTKKYARVMLIDAYVGLVTLVVGVLLQAFGAADLYAAVNAGVALLSLHAVCWILCLAGSARENPDGSVRLILLSMAPMCIGGIVETVLRILHVPVDFIGFKIGYLFFMIIQVGLVLRWLEQSAEKSAQLEHELYQNRVTMMLSQIQPHFLYNALTAIKQLCATDPARAEEAIGDFAGFLRTNLDSLSKTALIPLTRELVHAEQYFKLEQMRFGERVKLVYDLRYTGFSLPTLTVQPLVENAVRYGVTKKPEGGTVTVYADQTEASFLVRVSDDGVGFDQNAALSADREHIGLRNVQSRLAALCDGTLTVSSMPGQGTVVTIEIPKREADAE